MANAFMTPQGGNGRLVYVLGAQSFNRATSYGSDIQAGVAFVEPDTKYITMSDPNSAVFAIRKAGRYGITFGIASSEANVYNQILQNGAVVASGASVGTVTTAVMCSYTAKLNAGDVVAMQSKGASSGSVYRAFITICYLG